MIESKREHMFQDNTSNSLEASLVNCLSKSTSSSFETAVLDVSLSEQDSDVKVKSHSKNYKS